MYEKMDDTYKHCTIERNLLCLMANHEEMNSIDQVVCGPHTYNSEFNVRYIWIAFSTALVLAYLNERLEFMR